MFQCLLATEHFFSHLYICNTISWCFQKRFTGVTVLVNFTLNLQVPRQVYHNSSEMVTKFDLLVRATILFSKKFLLAHFSISNTVPITEGNEAEHTHLKH